jgi:hypothetical protein
MDVPFCLPGMRIADAARNASGTIVANTVGGKLPE